MDKRLDHAVLERAAGGGARAARSPHRAGCTTGGPASTPGSRRTARRWRPAGGSEYGNSGSAECRPAGCSCDDDVPVPGVWRAGRPDRRLQWLRAGARRRGPPRSCASTTSSPRSCRRWTRRSGPTRRSRRSCARRGSAATTWPCGCGRRRSTPAGNASPAAPAAARLRPPPLGAAPEAKPVTVQNLLFVLGGLLVGAAAIVFTGVAWATYGAGRPLGGARRRHAARARGAAAGRPPRAAGHRRDVRRGRACCWWSWTATRRGTSNLLGLGTLPGAGYAAIVCVVTAAVALGYGAGDRPRRARGSPRWWRSSRCCRCSRRRRRPARGAGRSRSPRWPPSTCWSSRG